MSLYLFGAGQQAGLEPARGPGRGGLLYHLSYCCRGGGQYVGQRLNAALKVILATCARNVCTRNTVVGYTAESRSSSRRLSSLLAMYWLRLWVPCELGVRATSAFIVFLRTEQDSNLRPPAVDCRPLSM